VTISIRSFTSKKTDNTMEKRKKKKKGKQCSTNHCTEK